MAVLWRSLLTALVVISGPYLATGDRHSNLTPTNRSHRITTRPDTRVDIIFKAGVNVSECNLLPPHAGTWLSLRDAEPSAKYQFKGRGTWNEMQKQCGVTFKASAADSGYMLFGIRTSDGSYVVDFVKLRVKKHAKKHKKQVKVYHLQKFLNQGNPTGDTLPATGNSVQLSLDSEEGPPNNVVGANTFFVPPPNHVEIEILKIKRQFCSGSIISLSWVLTIFGCVDKVEPSEILVLSGSDELGQGDPHNVTDIVIHPDTPLAANTRDSNLALLKVENQFVMSASTYAIPPATTPPGPYTRALVTFWGKNYGVDNTVGVWAIFVTTYDHYVCTLVFRNSNVDNMFCTQQLNEKYDNCQGGSGGPLVAATGLVGVVPWGKGCPEEKKTGLYIDVSYFTNWINENAVE